MAIEVERKFLVSSDGWRTQVQSSRLIVDHLIAQFETGKARIRLCDGGAVLTLKGQRRGLARREYHLPLPWADAQAMVAEFSSAPALEKCRHEVEVAGLIWQVDEYSGGLAGLVTADVELPSEEHPIILPDWAGPDITHDDR